MNWIYRISYFCSLIVAVLHCSSVVVGLAKGQIALYEDWISMAFLISCGLLISTIFLSLKYRALTLVLFSLFLLIISYRDLLRGVIIQNNGSFSGLFIDIAIIVVVFVIPIGALIGGGWLMARLNSEDAIYHDKL